MTVKPRPLRAAIALLNVAFVICLCAGFASGLALAGRSDDASFTTCTGPNGCGPATPPKTCYALRCLQDPNAPPDSPGCVCIPMCNMFCQCVLSM